VCLQTVEDTVLKEDVAMSDAQLSEIAEALRRQAVSMDRLAVAFEKIADVYVARYEGDGETRNG